MTNEAPHSIQRLKAILVDMKNIAVAVSGGIDSMTLSFIAHRTLKEHAEMFHAVSPAVPALATERVRRYARREGWRLHVINAGEFASAEYRQNPVNRCFYCKTSLYKSIAEITDGVLVSGTNLDDLADYRPGLEAARIHNVRHPYVESEISKSTVRDIARHLRLRDLSELPAAPCLSSRIETGIAIDPGILVAIDQIEIWLRETLEPRTVRCRVRDESIVVELDEWSLSKLDRGFKKSIAQRVSAIFNRAGHRGNVRFFPYRMGSAFVQPPGHE